MSLWRKVLIALAPFVIAGTIVAASYPRYRREKTACEAEGRFYWRGDCLPHECATRP
jgi:hypothetical protein